MNRNRATTCSNYAKTLGVIVLIGNATDDDLLRTARVYRARQLICVCGDDGINAEIAMNACELINPAKTGN